MNKRGTYRFNFRDVGISLWASGAWKFPQNKKIKCLPDKLMVSELNPVSLRGDKVKLANFQSKVFILVFWATWCDPCRKELVLVHELFKKCKD